jgi:hypothetical protein
MMQFSGEGIAAILASLATLVGVAGNVMLQRQQLKISAMNAERLEHNTRTLADNTQKMDEIHAATNVLVSSQTGTHPVLTFSPPPT